MRRRSFLRTLGCTLLVGGPLRRSRASGEGPAVASTWNFGKGVHEAALRLLSEGASPLDAARDAAMIVEADPEVDTVGYGGLPNLEGVVQLDAAVMDGQTLAAGAVAALRGILHPVAVAQKVMTDSEHVLIVGEGAREFALHHGFDKHKMLTPRSKREWKRRLAADETRARGDHDTVGVITSDSAGRMAVACSTSGLALKLPGRVGDSPLVGAGLYCDAEAGGTVATGIGEEVIRVCGSYQVVEFMRQGLLPEEAIRRLLERILRRTSSRREPPMVGMVAMRADLEVGFASTKPGFEAAVTRGGRHDLFAAPSLVGDTSGL